MLTRCGLRVAKQVGPCLWWRGLLTHSVTPQAGSFICPPSTSLSLLPTTLPISQKENGLAPFNTTTITQKRKFWVPHAALSPIVGSGDGVLQNSASRQRFPLRSSPVSFFSSGASVESHPSQDFFEVNAEDFPQALEDYHEGLVVLFYSPQQKKRRGEALVDYFTSTLALWTRRSGRLKMARLNVEGSLKNKELWEEYYRGRMEEGGSRGFEPQGFISSNNNSNNNRIGHPSDLPHAVGYFEGRPFSFFQGSLESEKEIEEFIRKFYWFTQP